MLGVTPYRDMPAHSKKNTTDQLLRRKRRAFFSWQARLTVLALLDRLLLTHKGGRNKNERGSHAKEGFEEREDAYVEAQLLLLSETVHHNFVVHRGACVVE
jgi:hypothetical protein